MTDKQDGERVPIGSDRVRFYFERQKMIDEWVSLRQEAAAEVGAWIEGRCYDLLDGIALDLSARTPVQVTVDYPGSAPTCGLAKQSWFDRAGRPRASVVVGVERKNASFVGDSAPCVGVYLSEGTKFGALHDALTPPKGGETWTEADHWRFWRPISASESYWQDIRPYEDEIDIAVRTLWKYAAPRVDKALGW